MLIRFGYDVTITCPQETSIICLLSLRPERMADLVRNEVIAFTPPVPTTTYSDLFGNTCRRMIVPAGDFRLTADAVIADSGQPDVVDLTAQEVPIAQLPDDTLLYLLGSRYCETDRLSQSAWDMFGMVAPGWNRVQAICNFVNGHIRFSYADARVTRTAQDAYNERIGVCRDFAHLAIALCRCMNIPARYVNGYLGDIGVPVVNPMDYSAWIEVYLGDRWITFDPRNNRPRIGRTKVAHGRDAADVPLIHSFGPHLLKSFKVWCYDEANVPA